MFIFRIFNLFIAGNQISYSNYKYILINYYLYITVEKGIDYLSY